VKVTARVNITIDIMRDADEPESPYASLPVYERTKQAYGTTEVVTLDEADRLHSSLTEHVAKAMELLSIRR
jgi:hypothetical protein